MGSKIEATKNYLLDLLERSSGGLEHPHPFSLNSITHRLSRMVAPSMTRGIEHVTTHPGLPFPHLSENANGLITGGLFTASFMVDGFSLTMAMHLSDTPVEFLALRYGANTATHVGIDLAKFAAKTIGRSRFFKPTSITLTV